MFERTYDGIDYEPIGEEEVREKGKSFWTDEEQFMVMLLENPGKDFNLTPFSYVRFIVKEQ